MFSCGVNVPSRLLVARIVFVELFGDDADVLVEAEDGACQEERLGDVVKEARGDVVDVDHLVRHQRNAAHDEQHRASIL